MARCARLAAARPERREGIILCSRAVCGSDRSISVDVGAIQTIDEDVTLDSEGRIEAKIGRRDCSGVPVAGWQQFARQESNAPRARCRWGLT